VRGLNIQFNVPVFVSGESFRVLVEKRTLRWYGHAARMESEIKPKLVLEARTEEGRGKDRPRVDGKNMWKD
jgi:hypothetical protein